MKHAVIALSIIAFGAVAAMTAPAIAQQDFSEGSEARPWNLYGESPARFEATVVDILCEVAGDCPEDCGGGTRQLGLVRSVDNVLVFPNKNSQPAFTGAADELYPFCGAEVEVDGLLIEDDFVGATNIYLVQRIRRLDDEEWTTANSWTSNWAEANPESAGSGPWFRRDPRVLAEIAEEGWFGLGLERDAEILEELFP